MAKWSSGWKWSDGTKWVSGVAALIPLTSFIDRLFYKCSVKLTHVAALGSTSAPTIGSITGEVGPRAQLPNAFEAFIDRNELTQFISVRVNQTSTILALTELTTQSGVVITTETSDPLVANVFAPFSVDEIRILVNQRSRQQPTG